MAGKGKKKNFHNPKYYTNRELSWILFNRRVLEEARDKEHPLFERLKFLSITSSNLDEFFMIRVASLKDMVSVKYDKPDISGLTPAEQLSRLSEETHAFVGLQYNTYQRSLLPLLEKNGLHIVQRHEQLTEKQARFADRFFKESVYPVLTPMAVDSSRPFPLIRNKTLNIGAIVTKKGKKKEYEFATVQVPSVLNRIVELPDEGDGIRRVILLEEIIEKNIDRLFLNYNIVCAHPFRIMRNADLSIEEDDASDLLKEIEKQVKKRQWGHAIRLEVESGADERLLSILKKELDIKENAIYRILGPLDLTFLMEMYGMDGFEHLKAKPHVPAMAPEFDGETDIFDVIKKGDVLLHHPYQSFAPVVTFIEKAAKDPDVLAIKQTLYRVSGNSPIIAALAEAAENGKQVSVLVELKARFDEENNIVWAKKLEQAGCHVIYGLVGLKTHCKITLVVRREEEGIVRYVHLGTGNYNDATAKLYTDLGLFTCREEIGEDATAVFNMLSGYSEPLAWNRLSLAPLWLKDKFLDLIGREKEHALMGRDALIIAKVNSLCDPDIIAALYEASSAGVEIRLIVRGICSLKVGIPGVSEHIEVRSVIGDFLEHARIFYFKNHEMPEVYLGSSDWMPRNLERRVEILFPVEKEELRARILKILECQLNDTVRSHILKPDGTYEKVDGRGKIRLDCQESCVREAARMERIRKDTARTRVFVPETKYDDR